MGAFQRTSQYSTCRDNSLHPSIGPLRTCRVCYLWSGTNLTLRFTVKCTRLIHRQAFMLSYRPSQFECVWHARLHLSRQGNVCRPIKLELSLSRTSPLRHFQAEKSKGNLEALFSAYKKHARENSRFRQFLRVVIMAVRLCPIPFVSQHQEQETLLPRCVPPFQAAFSRRLWR